jgi:hypothetical protein
MRPTKEQIEQEIERLEDLKLNVSHYSTFGDDNRAQIAAQIEVLVEGLSSDDIADRYIDEIYEAAISAWDWLENAHDDDTLSQDWEALRE